jgi:hypothetical protein
MALVEGGSSRSEQNKCRGVEMGPSNLVGERRTRRNGDDEMFLVRCEAGLWETSGFI